jgi:two-component system chemotaxis response regulator CheB
VIKNKIKVLIVEDSIIFVTLLKAILSKDDQIEICGVVRNGAAAVDFVKEIRPDVITMDINMPIMNGYDATQIIMHIAPVPIIILSANIDENDVNDTFKALEAGAVSVIEKPSDIESSEFPNYEKRLIQLVKLMSEVKVVTRISHLPKEKAVLPARHYTEPSLDKIEVVGIGASTGGPLVLEKILSGIPRDFLYPILIVQHITKGFTKGLVDWLNHTSSIPVKLAENNEPIRNGICYIAPDDMHLGINRNIIMLSNAPPLYNMRPAVGFLFNKLAENYGNKALGILLTGMGRDGSEELTKLKQTGAITIAQDEESCVIFGMPGEAVKMNGATHIMPPNKIIQYLEDMHNIKTKKNN